MCRRSGATVSEDNHGGDKMILFEGNLLPDEKQDEVLDKLWIPV